MIKWWRCNLQVELLCTIGLRSVLRVTRSVYRSVRYIETPKIVRGSVRALNEFKDIGGTFTDVKSSFDIIVENVDLVRS